MPANTDTTITIMLFEGGCLIDALSDKSQGADLATKIEQADQAAWTAGDVHFDLTLNPIEVGMAISALTSGQSLLAQNLGQKISAALSAKMQELGIDYDNGSGSVGGSVGGPSDGGGSVGGGESSDSDGSSGASSDPASEPASDPTDEPSDGQGSVGGE